MKKAIFVIILCAIPACASWNPFKGLVTVKAADQIQGAGKAEFKSPAAQAPIGENNQATNVGGNFKHVEITDNDSKVIEQNEFHWYLICGALIAYIIRMERSNAKKDARIVDFMNRQEDTQCKYIAALERQVFQEEERK